MPWSEGVLEQLGIVDFHTTEESDFYGSFISLLVELFPSSEQYQVSRSTDILKDRLSLPSSSLFAVVTFQYPSWRSRPSARGSADDQMRQRFREFASDTVLPAILYGLSAFGPQFCVYAFSSATRRIAPLAVPRNLELVNDIAPKARWGCDLLEPGGETKLREVVNAVKGVAAEL